MARDNSGGIGEEQTTKRRNRGDDQGDLFGQDSSPTVIPRSLSCSAKENLKATQRVDSSSDALSNAQKRTVGMLFRKMVDWTGARSKDPMKMVALVAGQSVLNRAHIL